jgi:glycosyltransferase involved in cell wall biosynthesis/predicted O-methyltransferase YrrM
MIEIKPPEIVVPDREGFGHAPSWAGSPEFLNDEHRGIYEATKDLPGWQDPADSQKLYELAYHNGAVILEIGVFGGRSAVVELRGALAAAREGGGRLPQFYGVDVDPGFVGRAGGAIAGAQLLDRCLLFHGDLAHFVREIPIVPTMVFVDGDHRYPGCWADLKILAELLAPGTPVMCHDYGGIPGVRRAVDEWIECGAYRRMGQFAGSMLLRAVGAGWRAGAAERRSVSRGGCGLSTGIFETVRANLWNRYHSPTQPSLRKDRHYTPVRDLTRLARQELRGERALQIAGGRGRWPYAAPADQRALPETMPGGYPWPRITVVTPSFNQGRYIEETILSVRNQGYPNLEHIIVDGGSSDETMEIVERYRDGLAHIIHEKDEGQSDAINKGFRLATGEILTWLNSDDLFAPGALAAAAMALRTSGADMVAGEVHIFRDGRFIQKHMTSCENGPLPLEDLLEIEACWLEGQFFYQPEVMFTREIWEKAGAHVRTDLYHSMDYELWVRMAHAGAKLRVIGRPQALFRAHPEQKTAGQVVGGFRAELPKARDAFLAQTGVERSPRMKKPWRARPRVVLYNDLGYLYGAGIAHRRVAEAFAEMGWEVHAVSAASSEHHQMAPKACFESAIDRISSLRPDLVVVGNLHGARVDPKVVSLLAQRWCTAFVTHDLWLLTGRCAYTGTCKKYLEGCDPMCTCACQHPKMEPEAIAPAWETKRRVLDGSPGLKIWANSEWARRKVEEVLDRVGPAGQRPTLGTIKFGLELETFNPTDKAAARDALGLPQDKFIIMSSASSLADPRKGLQHLADALAALELPDVLVICVGWFGKNESVPIPGMRALGYTKDPGQLALIYSAADVFVGPSLEEAFGQVFIEAAACGTPSIGYRVGGVPEAILEHVSGLLVDPVKPEALGAAIETLYGDRVLRERMGAWGRIWAESEWSMTASAHRIFCGLRRQGILDALGLGPKIDLSLNPKPAPAPVVVAPSVPAWRPISGFDHWEGPYPDRKIERCRWAHGPVAKFSLEMGAGGPARVLILCRNHQEGQRVRLCVNHRFADEHAVPADKHSTQDVVLSFRVNLTAGTNEIELHSWRWHQGARPMALLITGISLLREGQTAAAGSANGRAVHLNGAIEVKPIEAQEAPAGV